MTLLEKIKNILKSSQKAEPIEPEEEGSITSLKTDPPFIKGFQRKYLYIFAGAFAILMAGALFWGLQEKPKTEDVEKEITTQTTSGPQHIEGSHMLNIPKNYTEKAVKDAKDKKDEQAITKFDRPKRERFAEPPFQNRVEHRNSYSNYSQVREGSNKTIENKRQKALESPIRFDINK